LSLAIGKEGQNARLAAKLTGWRIDIKSQSQAIQMFDMEAALPQEEEAYQEYYEESLPQGGYESIPSPELSQEPIELPYDEDDTL